MLINIVVCDFIWPDFGQYKYILSYILSTKEILSILLCNEIG